MDARLTRNATPFITPLRNEASARRLAIFCRNIDGSCCAWTHKGLNGQIAIFPRYRHFLDATRIGHDLLCNRLKLRRDRRALHLPGTDQRLSRNRDTFAGFFDQTPNFTAIAANLRARAVMCLRRARARFATAALPPLMPPSNTTPATTTSWSTLARTRAVQSAHHAGLCARAHGGHARHNN